MRTNCRVRDVASRVAIPVINSGAAADIRDSRMLSLVDECSIDAVRYAVMDDVLRG